MPRQNPYVKSLRRRGLTPYERIVLFVFTGGTFVMMLIQFIVHGSL